MSKIKNGGLDLYGKVYSFNRIGGERVKTQIQIQIYWNRSPEAKNHRAGNKTGANRGVL